ncbi:MAG: hypothetical protein BWY20_02245 [Spirochaetes bacterium ADurb.Bin215]|nr:MAG: hypothetical protein BWY20_02245 [Spirochaetes bacterium ADurb.Bin215]
MCFKDRGDIPLDARANAHGFPVGVAREMRGKHIISDDDAAFDLRAEPVRAGGDVEIVEAGERILAKPVADAVEAGKVARRLGEGDHVVRTDRRFKYRNGHGFDRGAAVAEPPAGFFKHSGDFGGEAFFVHELLWKRNFQF